MPDATTKPKTRRTSGPDSYSTTIALLGILACSVATATAAGWLASRLWPGPQSADAAPSP
jgi:hypothetical protein